MLAPVEGAPVFGFRQRVPLAVAEFREDVEAADPPGDQQGQVDVGQRRQAALEVPPGAAQGGVRRHVVRGGEASPEDRPPRVTDHAGRGRRAEDGPSGPAPAHPRDRPTQEIQVRDVL